MYWQLLFVEITTSSIMEVNCRIWERRRHDASFCYTVFMNESDLVYIDEYGLLGSNFYWHKYEVKGLSKQDILDAGLTSERVQIHKELIPVLLEIDEKFQKDLGYRLYVKEGYRSKALYEIVYKRRCEKFGEEETSKLLNMKDMPHALGRSIDVALWDTKENKEVYLRRAEDGADALFADFYKEKTDPDSEQYQKLQEYVINTMQDLGFRLGKLREYFHFDYRPEEPKNYPL